VKERGAFLDRMISWTGNLCVFFISNI